MDFFEEFEEVQLVQILRSYTCRLHEIYSRCHQQMRPVSERSLQIELPIWLKTPTLEVVGEHATYYSSAGIAEKRAGAKAREAVCNCRKLC